MNIEAVFLGLVWIAFIIFGFVGGFKDIWYFGLLLGVITIVLAVRNFYLKRK